MSRIRKHKGHIAKGRNNVNSGYWLYGRHAVYAALKNPRRKNIELLVTEQHSNLRSYNSDVKVRVLKDEKISEIIGHNIKHQGIALRTSVLERLDMQSFIYKLQKLNKERSTILVLDHITDPQNLGSIIRSAVGFNVDGIIITKHNAPSETPALCKASSGMIEEMDIVSVNNLVKSLEVLKEQGYWICGMDGSGEEDISYIKNFAKIVIVMGSEGKGVRPLTMKNCDMMVKIPIASDLESLNVSVAAGIAMYTAYSL